MREHPEARTSVPKLSRGEKGLALFRERGEEIEKIAPHTYGVPSCKGDGTYTVNLGGTERCSCPDYQIRRERAIGAGLSRREVEPCKHIVCATFASAKAAAKRRRAKASA